MAKVLVWRVRKDPAAPAPSGHRAVTAGLGWLMLFLLLLIGLLFYKRLPKTLEDTANVLLQNMMLLFIPVIAGVMLAMQNAFSGAETVDRCLREPARAPRALAQFDRAMRHGPRQFSWFIFRVTNPTMRHLFMNPRNVLRMREALLSVLAGDIFGRMPFRPSLYAFRVLYYLLSLGHLRRSIRAWRARRRNIRVPQEAGAPAGP